MLSPSSVEENYMFIVGSDSSGLVLIGATEDLMFLEYFAKPILCERR
jgi:hypothetical protein